MILSRFRHVFLPWIFKMPNVDSINTAIVSICALSSFMLFMVISCDHIAYSVTAHHILATFHRQSVVTTVGMQFQRLAANFQPLVYSVLQTCARAKS